ncbi:MAG: hypothetical protein WCI95_00390 [bacterium]
MNKVIWMTMMVAGSVSLCAAQEKTKLDANSELGDVAQEVATPWRISAGVLYKNWLYEHDALQQRGPTTSKGGEDWENGSTSGNGSGLQMKVGRGDGTLDVSFVKSDFKYMFSKPDAKQEIDTVSRDFEVTWSLITGRNNQAEYGTIIGFRYLGMQKDDTITERSTMVEGGGNMNWLMLEGGYTGSWRPFETPLFQAHGSLLFFLGEASGTARSGMDTNWVDGVISETYSDQYSLAYGGRASFGVDVSITKRVWVSVDYMREWLYSFDSTDTGIVVFPDNSDALFIENHHAVMASVNYVF